MKKIIIMITIAFTLLCLFGTECKASTYNTGNEIMKATGPSEGTAPEYNITDIWSGAGNFISDGKTGDAIDHIDLTSALEPVKDFVSDMLFVIGNAIFFISTIILGVKYMFLAGGERAQVKESLMTLVVAAIFFYSSAAVTEVASGTMSELFINSSSHEVAIGKVARTVGTVAQILAFVATIMLGLKYMMASANEKAQIKAQMFPYVIGIGFVFATSTVLKFIADLGETVLQ